MWHVNDIWLLHSSLRVQQTNFCCIWVTMIYILRLITLVKFWGWILTTTFLLESETVFCYIWVTMTYILCLNTLVKFWGETGNLYLKILPNPTVVCINYIYCGVYYGVYIFSGLYINWGVYIYYEVYMDSLEQARGWTVFTKNCVYQKIKI